MEGEPQKGDGIWAKLENSSWDSAKERFKHHIRRHVIVEISDGQHRRLELTCGDLLEKLAAVQPQKDICKGGSVTYRDCRQIFVDPKNPVPSIEIRRHCLLICLPPVICFLVYNAAYIVLVEDLKVDGLISQLCSASKTRKSQPFEREALEILVSSALEHLHYELSITENTFQALSNRAGKKLTRTSILLEEIHHLKQPISMYLDRIVAFDKVFDEILSRPQELSKMALTNLYNNHSLYDNTMTTDTDIFILFEFFDQEMDQFSLRARNMKTELDNTERLLSLRLSLMRNQLIYLELAATLLGTGIAVGTCLSGIFGMNMPSGLEESRFAFNLTSAIVSVIAAFSFGMVLCILYMFRLEKLETVRLQM